MPAVAAGHDVKGLARIGLSECVGDTSDLVIYPWTLLARELAKWYCSLMRSTTGVAGAPASADLGSLSDGALLDHLRELQQDLCRRDAAFTQTLALAHARGAGDFDGCVSTRAWLKSQLRVSQRAATIHIDVATALADLPRFAELFQTGQVNLEHVHPLAELHKKAGPEVARIADEALAAYALELGPAEVRRLAAQILDYYRQVRDGDDNPGGPEPDPEPERFLDLARSFNSSWIIKGDLTPEAGSLLRAAIDALMRRPAPDDDRSAAERRHDAFEDLIRLAANTGDLPTKGGERPHLGALVHLDDLRMRQSRREQRSGALPEEIAAGLAAVEADLTARSGQLDPADTNPDDTNPDGADPAGPAEAERCATETAEPAEARPAATEPVIVGPAVGDAGDPADRGDSPPFVPALGIPEAGPDIDQFTTELSTEPDYSDREPPRWLPPAWLPDLSASTEPPDPLQAVLPGLGADRRYLPRPGDGAINDHGDRLSPEAARRVACDAAIHRVVLGPKGLRMNLGQRVRLIPAPMRRIIVARDRHCRFPGCDMPSAYTEVRYRAAA